LKYSGAVIILGAGASKGACVVGRKTPPLDAEFLQTTSKMFSRLRANGNNRERVTVWNTFKGHLNRAGLEFDDIKDWRLEQLSTFLEARANLKGLQLNVGRPRDHTQALRSLKLLVAHVLLSSGGAQQCLLHRLLLQAVQPKAIISFNYDLIVDQTLLELGWLNWSRVAYCGSKVAHVLNSNGNLYFRQIHAAKMKHSIPLIKLHGSINWERMSRKDGYRLSGVRLPESGRNTFELASIPGNPFLIPPVASKIEIKEGVLRKHWNLAVDYLHDASSWIIWGYSFPQTDTISQVLFKTALTRNRRSKPVIVVNPDATVVRRVKEVCQKVSIDHYVSMESLLLDWKLLNQVQVK